MKNQMMNELLKELEKEAVNVAHNGDNEFFLHYDDTFRLGVLSGMFRAIEMVERRLDIEKTDETQKGCCDLYENSEKDSQNKCCGCNS